MIKKIFGLLICLLELVGLDLALNMQIAEVTKNGKI